MANTNKCLNDILYNKIYVLYKIIILSHAMLQTERWLNNNREGGVSNIAMHVEENEIIVPKGNKLLVKK